MTFATYAAAQVLRVVPRVRLSQAVGRLCDTHVPAPLSRLAASLYARAYRVNLAEAEGAQIKILEEFLPPAVDPEEIRAAVRSAISAGAKDIGKVMSQVLPKYKGRADGKLINQIVREELQAG